MAMKITKEQLKQLIRESIREQLQQEDYAPGKYDSPADIVGRYSNVLINKFGLSGNQKARMLVVNVMTTAVNDAVEYGQEGRE